jgi:hypothetical protein
MVEAKKSVMMQHKQTAAVDAFDYAVTKIGTEGVIAVYAADALGELGKALALDCLAKIAQPAALMWSFFNVANPPATNMLIVPLSHGGDGSGGAYHYSCAGTDLYCDADVLDPNGTDRTMALYIAELSEVGQDLIGNGWDCGASNGEGLSRMHAEAVLPGVLDDFSTAAAWLDGPRTNWIDQTDPTDQNPVSTGCAVLFLWWLNHMGFTIPSITVAGGSTLAALYKTLTGESSAWSDFSAACAQRWPAGQLSGVKTDNPWVSPAATKSPPPSPRATSPARVGSRVVFESDVAAGSYVLTFVPMQTMTSSPTLSPAVAAQIAAILAQLLANTMPSLSDVMKAIEAIFQALATRADQRLMKSHRCGS